MTEAFRSPPPSPDSPAGTTGTAATGQEVVDTVQRIMGDDIAPPETAAGPPAPRGTKPSNGADTSTTEAAKDQAAQLTDTAKQAGGQVVDTVKEQAGQVTAEAGRQAKQLLSQAQSELTDQAAATQQRVAGGLHSLAEELAGMAHGSEQDGVATDLARQAADKANQAADWLDNRDPGSLLDEIRSFARRKPGAYLAIAVGAGVLAGRLTRGLTDPSDGTASSSPRHAVPVAESTPGALSGTDPYPALSSGVTDTAKAPITDVPVYPAGPPIPDQHPAPTSGFVDIVGDPRGDGR